MKIQWTKLDSIKSRNRLLLTVFTAVFAAAAHLFGNFIDLLPPCPFHIVTGYPCPFCGSARTAVRLVHGQFRQAALLNPAALVFYLYLGFFMLSGIMSALNGNTLQVSFTRQEKKRLRILGLLLLLMNWYYLLSNRAGMEP